jgi:hypothetical protein
VCRAGAPADLEAQGEPAVGPRFEAIVREGRACDVAAEPLEPAAVSRRDGDVGVEAHGVVLRHAGRRFGVGLRILRLDAIAQARLPEWLGFPCDALSDGRASGIEKAHLEWHLDGGSNSLRPAAPRRATLRAMLNGSARGWRVSR